MLSTRLTIFCSLKGQLRISVIKGLCSACLERRCVFLCYKYCDSAVHVSTRELPSLRRCIKTGEFGHHSDSTEQWSEIRRLHMIHLLL
jgi:hypothetical protein